MVTLAQEIVEDLKKIKKKAKPSFDPEQIGKFVAAEILDSIKLNYPFEFTQRGFITGDYAILNIKGPSLKIEDAKADIFTIICRMNEIELYVDGQYVGLSGASGFCYRDTPYEDGHKIYEYEKPRDFIVELASDLVVLQEHHMVLLDCVKDEWRQDRHERPFFDDEVIDILGNMLLSGELKIGQFKKPRDFIVELASDLVVLQEQAARKSSSLKKTTRRTKPRT